jgi:hypothetical protein
MQLVTPDHPRILQRPSINIPRNEIRPKLPSPEKRGRIGGATPCRKKKVYRHLVQKLKMLLMRLAVFPGTAVRGLKEHARCG